MTEGKRKFWKNALLIYLGFLVLSLLQVLLSKLYFEGNIKILDGVIIKLIVFETILVLLSFSLGRDTKDGIKLAILSTLFLIVTLVLSSFVSYVLWLELGLPYVD